MINNLQIVSFDIDVLRCQVDLLQDAVVAAHYLVCHLLVPSELLREKVVERQV